MRTPAIAVKVTIPTTSLTAWLHNDNVETRVVMTDADSGNVSEILAGSSVLSQGNEAYDIGPVRTNTPYFVYVKSDPGTATEPSDVKIGTMHDETADGTADPQNPVAYPVEVYNISDALVAKATKVTLPSITVREEDWYKVAKVIFREP